MAWTIRGPSPDAVRVLAHDRRGGLVRALARGGDASARGTRCSAKEPHGAEGDVLVTAWAAARKAVPRAWYRIAGRGAGWSARLHRARISDARSSDARSSKLGVVGGAHEVCRRLGVCSLSFRHHACIGHATAEDETPPTPAQWPSSCACEAPMSLSANATRRPSPAATPNTGRAYAEPSLPGLSTVRNRARPGAAPPRAPVPGASSRSQCAVASTRGRLRTTLKRT